APQAHPGEGGGFPLTEPHKAADCGASPGGRRARSPGLPGVLRLEGLALGTLCKPGLPALDRGVSHSPLSLKPAGSLLSLGWPEIFHKQWQHLKGGQRGEVLSRFLRMACL
ncbi:hypothetical protein LEMLEM_LOCUS8439, partial [Lemmus lemmus]